MDEDGPETAAEAMTSGLAMATLGTLVERYEPDREGAPIERFDDLWDQVQTARRKGVLYMAGNRLYRTDPDRLAEAEGYEEAQEAARATAEERGHEIEEIER